MIITIIMINTWAPRYSKHQRSKSTDLTLGTLKVVDKVFDEDAEWVCNSIGDDVNHEWTNDDDPAPTSIWNCRNCRTFFLHLADCFQTAVSLRRWPGRCVVSCIVRKNSICFWTRYLCWHLYCETSSAQCQPLENRDDILISEQPTACWLFSVSGEQSHKSNTVYNKH